MEYPELLTAYNDQVKINNQLSSGYEQCRLNSLSQESHIASIIEQHSHPIYVDFLIAIVSILIYAQVTKHWLLLQELAFELWCWAGEKIMPDKAFDCRSCWHAAQVAEGLCQRCYKDAHGVEPLLKQEEKKEEGIISDKLIISKTMATLKASLLKQCESCGIEKPPRQMALDGSINVCNQCYSQTTGDPMGTIRDEANF